jgi:hypothetical protein
VEKSVEWRLAGETEVLGENLPQRRLEWRLAGETEVLGENLPQRRLVHHKFMAFLFNKGKAIPVTSRGVS